jgi:hypothetical protein
MRKLLSIFLISFLVACIFQSIRWTKPENIDVNMWINQARMFGTPDPQQYDFLLGYGHPGGPIIIGIKVFHSVGIHYKAALMLLLTLCNSFGIGLIAVLCYILRKDTIWWIAATLVLSLQWMFDLATPPSALAAILVVLLCIYTLYLYEQYIKINNNFIIVWGVISGILTATRCDIGVLTSGVFLIFLATRFSLRKIGIMALVSVIAFWIFDPYMWYMPYTHVGDLVYKIIFHYDGSLQSHPDIITMLKVSFFTAISIILAVYKRGLSLPTRFVYMLTAMSIVLYTIFLTSSFSVTRYYMPVVFIWETFLPLILFEYIFYIQKKKRLVPQVIVSILLICYSTLYLFLF